MSQAANEQTTQNGRLADRRLLVRTVQRKLVPFLSANSVEERLAEIERAGILSCASSEGTNRYELVATLNTCLFDHPAFFQARESRAIQDELHFIERTSAQKRPAKRYRIEQRVTVLERELLDDALIQLWLPAPIAIEGLQRVRLLTAEPRELAAYYLPTAGQIYGAPLLITPGNAVPSLYLIFDVERMEPSLIPFRDSYVPVDPDEEEETTAAANWAKTLGFDRGTIGTTHQLIDLILDRIEDDFSFAFATSTRAPVRTLLTDRKGDTLMHTRLVASALRALGITTKIGSGQRLMLENGKSKLTYPGSTGYDHVFLQWRDADRGETGCVDLSYLERWCFAGTEANTTNHTLRTQLQEVGQRAKRFLRRNPYPLDLILSGCVPKSLMRSFCSNESYALFAPVNVELEASLLES